MRIVLICSDPVLGRLVLPSLRRLRARYHLISDARAEHLRLSRCCTGVLLASRDLRAERPEHLADLINRLAGSAGVDCVIASDLEALTLLARAAPQIKAPIFPMPDAETLIRISNKCQFRATCAAAGLTLPKALRYASKYHIDPEEVADAIGFPAVVQPVDGRVIAEPLIVDTPDMIVSKIIRAEGFSCDELLVQEYVEGRDAGFGGLALRGRVERSLTYLGCDDGSVEFTPLPGLTEAVKKLVGAMQYSGVISVRARVAAGSGAMQLLDCTPAFSVRIRAARIAGLDLVSAGVAPDAWCSRQPETPPSRRYMPITSMVSWKGLRHITTGTWAPGGAFRTIMETLSDPLPLIAELDRPADRTTPSGRRSEQHSSLPTLSR